MVKRRSETKTASKAKAKQVVARVSTSKKGTRKQKALRERRSAAAKKGWETRRAKQAAQKSLDEKKRRSAKKTKLAIELEAAREAVKRDKHATKREKLAKAAKQAELVLRRSEAAKKGWATRKAAALKRRADEQLDIRAPMLERKDLRPSLPKKFEELKNKSEKTLDETRKKLTKEDRAHLRSLSFVDLINAIKSPRLKLEAEYSGSKEAALKIAYSDIDAYWDVQFERLKRRQQLSRDVTLTYFNNHMYGTEMEAYNMVDDTFRILTTQYDAQETAESKLRRLLNEAYATPQFDAIMTIKAGELEKSKHELYSWFYGSPSADFFVYD